MRFISIITIIVKYLLNGVVILTNMRVLVAIILFFSFISTSKAGTFSEVFGSEGAAGIGNPNTRSLSWTLQYLTLTGAIGFVGKKMFDTGFFEPFGFEPDYSNLSPLAYDKNYYIDYPDYKLFSAKEKISKINYLNDLSKDLFSSRLSLQNNKSLTIDRFRESIIKKRERNYLINRYSK